VGVVETVFKWLDFKVTNRCNNKCLYCGVKQDAITESERIPLKSAVTAIQDAIDIGFTHFALLGGEPSVRADITDILSPFCGTKRVHTVMVISNMLIFNEMMYRKLFSSNSEYATLVASIDSLVAPNFKNQTPERTLSHIKRVISIANEYSTTGTRGVHIHSVISRENFRNLFNHASFFNAKGLEISMALVEPFQVTDFPKAYNQFSKTEIEYIIAELDHLETINELGFANNVLRNYLRTFILDENKYFESCTAGVEHVIIDSDGLVYPCLTEAYRQGLSFGNITNKRFFDLYKKMIDFHCDTQFRQTCWDHYLWTCLATTKRRESNNASN
jgi:radical SAM protein with 4Fe4S-binding SPASM domain